MSTAFDPPFGSLAAARDIAVFHDGVVMSEGKVVAEGDLDFRGTLGVARDTPVGFKEIRLKFETESDADQETMNKVISVTERYCVVLQTIRAAPPVVVSVNEQSR